MYQKLNADRLFASYTTQQLQLILALSKLLKIFAIAFDFVIERNL